MTFWDFADKHAFGLGVTIMVCTFLGAVTMETLANAWARRKP